MRRDARGAPPWRLGARLILPLTELPSEPAVRTVVLVQRCDGMAITLSLRLQSGRALLLLAAVAAVGAAAPEDAPEEAPASKKVIRRGIPAIWVMEPDGSNPRPLVKMRGMRWHGSPTWSRDGHWVAFDAMQEGFARSDVFVYAFDGPQKGTLKNLGPGNCPVFSPDGGTIAFHLAPGNSAAADVVVWLMKPDGTVRRRLCDGDHAQWSPDGKTLLVMHEQVTPARIDEVTVETGEARRVLDSQYAKIPGAAYSPDGRRMEIGRAHV